MLVWINRLQNSHAGHQRWVWDCVFSVDGAFLVTGESYVVIGFGYFVLYFSLPMYSSCSGLWTDKQFSLTR